MGKMKIKAGYCPSCGSDIIDYSAAEFEDDNMLHYNCKCITCGYEFEEWYSLKFEGQNVGENCDVVVDAGTEYDSLNDLINNDNELKEEFDAEIKVQDKLDKIVEQMNRLYDNLSKKSELLKEAFFGHNIEQHKHSDPEIYKECSEYLYKNLKSEQTYFECCNKIKSKFPDVELKEFNDSEMFELYATSYNHNSIFKDLVDRDEYIDDMKKKYSL